MDTPREFTIRGTHHSATPERFKERLARVEPEPIRKYSVEINDRRYPIKQAVAVGLGIPRAGFTTQDAFRILASLGFKPTDR